MSAGDRRRFCAAAAAKLDRVRSCTAESRLSNVLERRLVSVRHAEGAVPGLGTVDAACARVNGATRRCQIDVESGSRPQMRSTLQTAVVGRTSVRCLARAAPVCNIMSSPAPRAPMRVHASRSSSGHEGVVSSIVRAAPRRQCTVHPSRRRARGRGRMPTRMLVVEEAHCVGPVRRAIV